MLLFSLQVVCWVCGGWTAMRRAGVWTLQVSVMRQRVARSVHKDTPAVTVTRMRMSVLTILPCAVTMPTAPTILAPTPVCVTMATSKWSNRVNVSGNIRSRSFTCTIIVCLSF